MISLLTPAEAVEVVRSPFAAEDLGGRLLAVEMDTGPAVEATRWLEASDALRTLPCVSLALGASARLRTDAFDVVVDESSPGGVALAADAVARVVGRRPQAAMIAVQVLRASAALDVADGLVLESMAYSTLQAGPEFRAWLAARPSQPVAVDDDLVVVAQLGDGNLRVTLNRPKVHNAFNSAMRDAMVEVLRPVVADPSIAVVELRGAGRSFCSGGDLNEFGSAPDPAAAHLVRVTRSPPWWVSQIGGRLKATVHGACIGAGIELAAWASEVTATDDSYFVLPEVGMGLVPGSGGTVSLPRRIGRQRTAWLALTGHRLDADDAHRWGLVDRRVAALAPE